MIHQLKEELLKYIYLNLRSYDWYNSVYPGYGDGFQSDVVRGIYMDSAGTFHVSGSHSLESHLYIGWASSFRLGEKKRTYSRN
jgi:hypothetical protein